MLKQNGFTIVEMIVVTVVLVSLLTVSVVGIRGMQASARDKERTADIDTLAMNIETMHSQEIRDSSNNLIKPQGSYPPVAGTISSGFSIPNEVVNELEEDALRAPGQSSQSLRSITHAVCGAGSTSSPQVCKINNTVLNSQLTDAAIGINSYIYVPITRFDDSRLCTVALIQSGAIDGCRSFKLYHVKESGSSVVMTEGKRR